MASNDKASLPVAPQPLIKTLLPLFNVVEMASNISYKSGILFIKISIVIKSSFLIMLMAFLILVFENFESPIVCGEGYSVGSYPSLNLWAIFKKSSASFFD